MTRMEGGVRYPWYCCYMLNILWIKQNWAKTVIRIIRELDLVTFHEHYLRDEASKIDARIVYDVKTQQLQVRDTPCTCCSRSQQRSSLGLRLKLTPLLVFDRTRMVNITFSHHFFCSWYIWQSTFHTPVVEEVAGPRDVVKQCSQPYFQAVSKTMPWRKHKLTRSDTAGI